MLDVSVDTSMFEEAIHKLEQELPGEMSKFLDDAGELIVNEAVNELNGHFKRDTGEAERSIKVISKSENVITVGIDEDIAMHAVYLHEGTKDHWVAPVNADSLAWQQDGQWRYSKGHMVSGIQGYPFLTIAAEKSESRIGVLCEEFLQKAVNKAGF